MTRLPVLTYPAASLKKPSQEVTDFGQQWLKDLIENMFETMYAEDGLGLAAPQVGENVRLFVMDIAKPDPLNPENKIQNPLYLINPEIIQANGEYSYEEGCLSCPELLVDLGRAKDIVVRSHDADGNLQQHALSEVAAVCVQHEMDHLKGVLLTDYISRLQREFYGKKRMRRRRDEKDVSLL